MLSDADLHMPSAWGEPVAQGLIKTQPAHFQVREWLGFEADGEGDHALLQVRKQGANTMWVARALAQHAKVHPKEVGFAGLKDRHAVTEQAFTVPLSRHTIDIWQGMRGTGFEVLSAARHRRKLKRGVHKGNDFRIVIDALQGDVQAMRERLQLIATHGVPNYFGAQRFGINGQNVQAATAWFTQQQPLQDRIQRNFALSAARAVIFNAVLAMRVQQGTWNVLQAGDVANLNGSGSVFVVDTVDETLQLRCQQLDIHPTGPLWGQGALRTQGAVMNLEHHVAQRFNDFAHGLATAGLTQERRALRVQVQNLTASFTSQQCTLDFRLHRGCYATTVLSALLDNASNAIDEGDA